jgi:type IV fimbrial biogenesis protein FimT
VLNPRLTPRGFTLVEVLISIAVLGVLIALGVPGFGEWLQNQQIRAAADATLNGLQVARGEAVRRNAPVRFVLVSDLTSNCILPSDPLGTPAPLSWVVSLDDPTGACDAVTFKDEVPAPPVRILQRRTNAEGSPNSLATVAFVPAPPAAPVAQAANTVTFSPLGNVIANADASKSIVRIDVTNPSVAAGAVRPLRIAVNPGGSARMCDPALAASDPRGCPAWP